MPHPHVIELATRIAAPPQRCFDLSRSVDVHLLSARGTGEIVVAGRASGSLGAGETVTWSGRHLGWRRELTVAITAFDRPRYFRDAQVRGPFRQFDHDHWFDEDGKGGTLLRERFAFSAPWGLMGWMVSRFLLVPHLRSFLTTRAQVIRELAEGEGWTRFLTETNGSRQP